MEPLIVIIVPGLVGGIVLALLIVLLGGNRARTSDHPRAFEHEHLEPPSTNMINMARIRVAGVGGLGMVAMSIVVAIFVPRIRLSMAIALLLGGAMATILIALRRRQGPLTSSNHPGAHSMFPIDAPSVGARTSGASAPGRRQEFATVPAPLR